MAGREPGDPLAAARARAVELERRIADAPDEDTAREAADELHALLDTLAAQEGQPQHPR